MENEIKEFYKDDEKTLNRILGYERQLDLASSKLENTNNTIEVFSYELGKDIESDPKVLLIVDKAKEKISLIRGPLPPDSKGRLPGDPHYGHGH